MGKKTERQLCLLEKAWVQRHWSVVQHEILVRYVCRQLSNKQSSIAMGLCWHSLSADQLGEHIPQVSLALNYLESTWYFRYLRLSSKHHVVYFSFPPFLFNRFSLIENSLVFSVYHASSYTLNPTAHIVSQLLMLPSTFLPTVPPQVLYLSGLILVTVLLESAKLLLHCSLFHVLRSCHILPIW